jgi:hypothetical protein
MVSEISEILRISDISENSPLRPGRRAELTPAVRPDAEPTRGRIAATTNEENSMTDEEDQLAQAMAAYKQMFGGVNGPPYGWPISIYTDDLRQAVARGRPIAKDRYTPTHPLEMT